MSKKMIDEALKYAKDTRCCIIGENVLEGVADVFFGQFSNERKAVLISDPRTKLAAADRVAELLKNAGVEVAEYVLEPGGKTFHADYHYVTEVKAAISAHPGFVPIAVGSGVVNDLTKRASGELNIPYMVVATAASVDGYSSFGASLRSPEGAKQTYSCPAPRAIIADLGVIRSAPDWMAASGFADLLAKIPAGADWILARELGASEWHDRAWHTVQDGLPEALSNPEGVAKRETVPLTNFIEGLMLGGFAMQDMESSRPASGAEHMFSHILEMRNHTFKGDIVPHGIQVGVFTRFICAVYEQVLAFDYHNFDIEKCVAAWPALKDEEQVAIDLFKDTPFPNVGIEATRKKYIDRDAVRNRLNDFVSRWDEIRARLAKQLVTAAELERRLRVVGAPAWPEEIGSTREQTVKDAITAQHMRDRYNVLDFLAMTGQMNEFARKAMNLD